jgi:hypothetical protein
VKKLSKVFRGKFTDGLIELQDKGIIDLGQPLIKGLKICTTYTANNG